VAGTTALDEGGAADEELESALTVDMMMLKCRKGSTFILLSRGFRGGGGRESKNDRRVFN